MRIVPAKKLQVESLRVEVYGDRCQMGAAAASQVAARMMKVLATKAHLSMVFAAAPSQDEFLFVLSSLDGLAWDRVIAFHMDEYVGLTAEAPQSFRRYLGEHLFDKVRPGTVYLIRGETSGLLAEALDWLSLAAHIRLPHSLATLREQGLSSDALGRETRRGRAAGVSTLLAGIELVDLEGVTRLDDERITADLRALRGADPDGLVLSWDLWRIPLERLEMVRATWHAPSCSELPSTGRAGGKRGEPR